MAAGVLTELHPTAARAEPPHRRLHAGAIVVFDELFNFPEYREHELKALWEYLNASSPPLDVQVIGTSTRDVSFNVYRDLYPGQSCALKLVPRSCSSCATRAASSSYSSQRYARTRIQGGREERQKR